MGAGERLYIVKCSEPAELYEQYATETQPQPVYLRLSLRDGTLSASYAPETKGTEGSVVLGYTLRWRIPELTADAANELMEKVAEDAQIILNDWEKKWIRSNMEVTLGKDATSAYQRIKDTIGWDEETQEHNFPDHQLVDGVAPSLIGDWFDEELDKVTASTSDDELEDLRMYILGTLSGGSPSGVSAVSGLEGHLVDLRDKKIHEAETDAEEAGVCEE